ncbi:MAG: hypothetical protein KKA73_25195 [Chloroflexi bacterium]|nr:hypothetical protein [Chloroflexota bacterium]MBU1750994.1 hypothetical protein [Chloroflexota bacterium]
MLRYIGDPAYILGVPARDLTDDEADEHGGAAHLVATGLYEVVEEPASAPDPAPDENELPRSTRRQK